MKNKKIIIASIIIISGTFFFSAERTSAATINAASCNQADVQTAINSASEGDIVQVPAGNCTWSGQIIINKSILLKGQGIGNTTIVNNYGTNYAGSLVINQNLNTEITGFTFKGNGVNGGSYNIQVYSGIFKIHDNAFDDVSIAIRTYSNSSGNNGVIYKNTFDAITTNAEVIQVTGDADTAWSTSDLGGTDKAVYIEDNVFTKTGFTSVSGHAVLGATGARYVFRYNTGTNMNVDAHGNRGTRATRWFEVYNNNWGTTPGVNAQNFAFLRGGTGVVYNNTYNDQSTYKDDGDIQLTDFKIHGYVSTCWCSYPALDQIGRGINQTSSPLYLWNNTRTRNGVTAQTTVKTVDVGTVGACNTTCGNTQTVGDYIQVGRDYYNGIVKPGYTAYAYPHPLRNEGSSNVINAVSCNQADVQTAINSASEGDIVQVPAGNCTWNIGVVIPNTKVIWLKGSGQGVTNIHDNTGSAIRQTAIELNTAGNGHYRISDFTFTHTTTNDYAGVIALYGDGIAWRIDHITFQDVYTNGININGLSYGLIDHCTWNKTDVATTPTGIMISGGNQNGDAYWNIPYTFGSDKAVVIEDCVFNYDKKYDSAVQSSNGVRYVFRHNTVAGTGIDMHGADSSHRSCAATEVYNNTFSGSTGVRVLSVRGGSSVFYNNVVTGAYNAGINMWYPRTCYPDSSFNYYFTNQSRCDGTQSIDGNEDSTGYPCKDQPGISVPGQTKTPLYEWNNTYNGSDLDWSVRSPICSSSPFNFTTADQVVLGRDYFNNTQKPGYKALAYPHPLRNEPATPSATCQDNIQNQDETGVDCGGVCPACPVAPEPPVTYNLTNFISLVSNWLGAGNSTSDVNNDGIVNTRDLGIIMSGWGS